MRSVRPFVLAFSLLSLQTASAWADDTSPPKTTASGRLPTLRRLPFRTIRRSRHRKYR